MSCPRCGNDEELHDCPACSHLAPHDAQHLKARRLAAALTANNPTLVANILATCAGKDYGLTLGQAHNIMEENRAKNY
jgi:hypothetical protein